MKRMLIAVVAFAIYAAYSSSSLAGVNYSGRVESSAEWSGFGADFSPSWVGKTTVVEYTPENAKALADFGGAYGAMCCGNTWCLDSGYEQRWTVNKISSSARVETNVDANFLLGNTSYVASSGDLRSNANSNYANFAHYAEIVTYDNRILANASAIAFQNAQLGERSFGASGKISAVTLLESGSKSAQSSAKGSSCFEASYGLEKDTPFSFSLDLASTSNVELAFSASDLVTGETLWSLTPSGSDKIRHLEWSGILEAGRYSFALNASTDSLIDQMGVQSLGGEALYDISFDFDAESYFVPRFLTINDNYQKDPVWFLDPLPCLNGFLVVGDVVNLSSSESNSNLSTTLPEPNILVLLFAGCLSYVAFRWTTR
ncbi:MAG: hypothetical protein ABFC77_13815 [Thermoguttaceae bacterium]